MRQEKEKPRKDPKLSSSFTKILEQRMENVELIILPNIIWSDGHHDSDKDKHHFLQETKYVWDKDKGLNNIEIKLWYSGKVKGKLYYSGSRLSTTHAWFWTLEI